LAGILLLGTLLTSIVIAGANITAQNRRSERRLQGCRIAEEFLEKSWPSRTGLLRTGEGDVAGYDGWKWRAKAAESDTAVKVNVQAAWLELYAPDWPNEPSARVEILVPGNASNQNTTQGSDAG
jgi:hypothetical protein